MMNEVNSGAVKQTVRAHETARSTSMLSLRGYVLARCEAVETSDVETVVLCAKDALTKRGVRVTG